MAEVIPAVNLMSTVVSAVTGAKTLFGGGPKPAAPAPVVEPPKVMPTADTASQAALLAKKKAASAQTSGRASTILSQGAESSTLGG